jgi:hypothetical protein
LRDDFRNDFEFYFSYFVHQLEIEWAGEIESWKTCNYQRHPNSASFGVCSAQWAYQTNLWNCQGIWEEVRGDLSRVYYQRMFLQSGVPEMLIAQAGIRLAHILESIFGAKATAAHTNSSQLNPLLDAERHFLMYKQQQEQLAQERAAASHKSHHHQVLDSDAPTDEDEASNQPREPFHQNRFDILGSQDD